jgi:hypothetical protein
VCSCAAVGLRFRAVSTVIERVSLLRGYLPLKPEQACLKVEDAVLLGNGTVSVGIRFPTKAPGSIKTSDITQHHIPEERNP